MKWKKNNSENSDSNVSIVQETLDFMRKSEAAQAEREEVRNNIARQRNEILKELLTFVKKE